MRLNLAKPISENAIVQLFQIVKVDLIFKKN